MLGPIYRWSRHHLGFLGAINLLRILNLVFAAMGLGWLLLALKPFCSGSRLGYLAALTTSLFPMFLVFTCRVSNNALSMFIIGMVFYLLSQIGTCRRLSVQCLLLGLLLGAGTWIRVDIMPFYLAATAVLLWQAQSRQLPWRHALGSIVVVLGVAAIVSWSQYSWNLRHYSTLFPSQEMFRIESGASVSWTAALAVRLIGDVLLQRLLVLNLWTSGWSFLFLPVAVYAVYGLFLAAIGISLGWFLLRHFKGRAFPEQTLTIACMLVFGFVCAGAVMHALLSVLANAGIISTPSYYATPGFIPVLCLGLYSLQRLSRHLSVTVLIGLLVLFILAEWAGIFLIGVPYWTQTISFAEAFCRLQVIHPAFPSPQWLPLLLFLFGAVGVAIGRIILRMGWAREEAESSAGKHRVDSF